MDRKDFLAHAIIWGSKSAVRPFKYVEAEEHLYSLTKDGRWRERMENRANRYWLQGKESPISGCSSEPIYPFVQAIFSGANKLKIKMFIFVEVIFKRSFMATRDFSFFH